MITPQQFFLYINILCFLGCCPVEKTIYNSVNVNGRTLLNKKVYDRNCRLHSEAILDLDSIYNGYYKEYQNGSLILSGNYESGKKNGLWIYLNGKGDTASLENWFIGKQFGEQKMFFEERKNGRQEVERYSFFSLDGTEIFYLKLSPEGKIEDFSGVPMFCAFNKEDLKKEEKFYLMTFIGIPDSTKFELSITGEIINSDKLIYKKVIIDKDSSELEFLSFAKKHTIEMAHKYLGKIRWSVCLKIVSNSGILLSNKCTDIDVNVSLNENTPNSG